ncbi:MAG TPA: hypothetical protein VM076_16430 [Gemmatimonadaceae bacterium]|nr:hypothetical protein [Gemmatimonadaceae bacterium]
MRAQMISVVTVACVALAGCRASSPPVDTRTVVPRETVTTVLVRNHHGADLRLWVVSGDGASHRLGIVPKLGSTNIVLPRSVVLPAQVLFVAIPMSGDDPQTSGPFTVEAGAKLVFTIAAGASLSTLSRLP